jgi:hypothetical protein
MYDMRVAGIHIWSSLPQVESTCKPGRSSQKLSAAGLYCRDVRLYSTRK